MQDNLKIALIQSDLFWEDPSQNIENFAQKIDQITKAVDIILLPEMFSTGFTMNPSKVAETMEGDAVNWMRDTAKRTDTAIGGSLVIEDHGRYYNRFVFVSPEGDFHTYDKRHTFTLAGEDKEYAAGKEKIIIAYKGWRICPLVCYDLRFPVWSRNVEDYDVLTYVANWPKPRINAWDVLLKARAIENMCYCIGVNRVGIDENGLEYPGHSSAYNGLGEIISNLQENQEQIEIVNLEKSHLESIRRTLKFLDDKDDFNFLSD